MKRSTTELTIRPFSVTITSGHGGAGSDVGNAFSVNVDGQFHY
jgi:hypothetical protein